MIVEGIVQGHRDGYGLVVSEQGDQDVYLPPQQMRAVMHMDRVRVKIVRQDKRGRPEGQVLEILERSNRPVIGRLLQESGVWLLAPEDKRYAQDILIPANALGGARNSALVLSAQVLASRCVLNTRVARLPLTNLGAPVIAVLADACQCLPCVTSCVDAE